MPWEHLERVFLAPGDTERCWCQWFRTRRGDCVADASAERAAALRSQASGQGDGTSGLVACLGDEPVGWVSVAPRAEHARLVEMAGVDGGRGVWSITCFRVRHGFDGEGITELLLHAAVDRARSHGAETVEAYTRVLQADGATSRDLLAEAGFVATDVPGLPRAFRLTV